MESGEPRDPHHIAALIGYGAAAVNPYLMLESTDGESQKVITSMEKSLLKIISKMGISTIRSYNGAQVFEAVGLDRGLVERHFTGTPSRIGGIGLDGLAREALHRHSRAWPDAHGEALPDHVEDALLPAASKELLPQGGQYQWRRDGERHMWDPGTITGLQTVARGGGRETYKEFAAPGGRGERVVQHDPRAAEAARRARADLGVRGRAGRRDRQALHDRRDEPGLAVLGGARDARDRHEPPRRAVEHRRGRRGPAPVRARPQRRPAPVGDQAGGAPGASA